METRQTAEAFSSHRFTEVYDRLADDVRWVLPDQATIQGRTAVIAACEAAAGEFAQLAGTDTLRFLSVADDGTAAVDATIRTAARTAAPRWSPPPTSTSSTSAGC